MEIVPSLRLVGDFINHASRQDIFTDNSSRDGKRKDRRPPYGILRYGIGDRE